ncbi:MAG: hypothetical protein LBM18_00800 [Oscillospiraceae bacterium]|jgi:hypothetical protein|nr:hypothetical protein [Oscillospiraceae bacterium]
MFEEILSAAIAALAQGENRVTRVFPAGPTAFDGRPLVVVGLGGSKLLSSGLGDYIGVRREDSGLETEVYGRRLETELRLTVYLPEKDADAALIESCAGELELLTRSFPAGLRAIEFSRGEISRDSALRCFVCECLVRCSAYFVAESRDEEEEFLNFKLRGVFDSAD